MSKREMKRVAKKIITGIICILCITAQPVYSNKGNNIQRTEAAVKQTADYSKYSNVKHEWYIIRKDKHEKAGGGIPSGMRFSDYNAYYINGKTKEKVIYLSFDCGYENGYTKSILKTLKRHNAKAIFFVTKPFIESNPDLVKQMKKQGHLVGNHTCTHPSLPGKSVSEIKKGN